MNIRILKLVLWIGVAVACLLLAFLALVIKVDYSSDIPVEKPVTERQTFSLYPHIYGIEVNNFKEAFPYGTYLDSANWLSIESLKNDLLAMDSVNRNNEMVNQEILSIALTEKLEDRIRPSFVAYNPDSLIRIIQWAEKFNAWSEMDATHTILFQVIYNYWMNFVSNSLRENYEKSYQVKYNYKFRYIADRLREKQFSTPMRGTYLEKTINKLIEKNWTYLFNKFWHATTVAYKLVVLFLAVLIIFPYFYIFKRIKNKSI